MKRLLTVAALSGILIVAAQAQREPDLAERPAAAGPARAPAGMSAWTRPLTPAPGRVAASPAAAFSLGEVRETPAAEMDVVDAHWMALTMWGEARGQGEAGMRAVGHVIRNRWLAKRNGRYVTDTVSAAFQFSCWNEGDPNREAMLNIESARPGSEDHRLWLEAKRVAAEILTGRSADPTAGALFYHTDGVQPTWSRGLMPAAQIGKHLFFRTAR